MYYFSNSSLKHLETCRLKLQLVAKAAIDTCPIDFGISCGYRTLEQQTILYNEGKSKCDGIVNISKHQSNPSLAFDFFAYVDGKANYEDKYMYFVGAWILRTSLNYTHLKIEWGGLWDFKDTPHIQLIS